MPINVGQIVVSLVGNTATFSMQMTEAERKAAQAGSSIQGSLAKLTGSTAGFSGAGAAVRKLSEETREAKGTMALMGDELGVRIPRYLRGFIASLPGVGTALSAAFTGFAILGIAEVLGHAIGKVMELRESLKKLQDSPIRIADEFRAVNLPLETSNDQLRVTNDQLRDAVAKLQGKPTNGLQIALHEAWVEADKLAGALAKELEAAQKVLKEESIGTLKGFLTGTAETEDIQKKNEEFRRSINTLTDEGNQKVHDAKTAAEAHAAAVERDTAIQKAYAAQLAWVNSELKTTEGLKAHPPTVAGVRSFLYGEVYGEVPEQVDRDQDARLSLLHQYRNTLRMGAEAGPLMTENADLSGQKRALEATAANAALAAPFETRINALGAKLQAAVEKFGAAGGSDLERALADASGKAEEAISQLNVELGKHHQHLITAQQDEIKTKETEIALVELETKWKDALVATSRAIEQKTAVQLMMNAAIGKGAAAQRQATIESEVMQHFGDRYKTMWGSADANAMRGQLGDSYDAQRAGASAANVERLNRETAATERLTAAERDGAEAIHQVALANALVEMVAAGAGPGEMFAKMTAMQAEWRKAQGSSITQIERQTEATQRLTAAEWGGVDAIRAAEEENIRNSGITAEEAEARIAHLRAQRQQQDVQGAVKLTHDDQLETLQRQLVILQEQRAAKGATLVIDKAIHDVEGQITRIQDQQRLATGSMRDGVRAFFDELRQQTRSAAQDVHDILAKSFDGLNENLSKLLTGQKASWGAYLQDMGQSMVKSSLQKAEGALVGVIFGSGAQKADGSSESAALWVRMAGSGTGGSGGGILGKILHMGGGSEGGSGGGSEGDSSGGDSEDQFGWLSSVAAFMGGGRAAGGDVSPGTIYPVGENGPEFFSPRTSGRIIPNGAFGGTTIHVDARYSRDPVLTANNVRQAVMAAHSSAVVTASQVMQERARRVPGGK